MTLKAGQTRTKKLSDGTVVRVTLTGQPSKRRRRKRKPTPGKGR